MLTLALDTALDRTAVALSGNGVEHVIVERMERGHAERLMPMVERALAEAGLPLSALDRIGVNVGPGSFTGIRIAVAAARGLGLALGIPVVGVDSLAILARSLTEPAEGHILAALDARRGELYAALHDRKGAVLMAPFAADAETVWATVGDAVAVMVGSGAPILAHQAAISGRRVPPTDPADGLDPLMLARLAAAAEPESSPPKPFYIRPPDAKPQLPMVGLLQ
ncbi:tRNA (adenosine(37)-N6)-threonylcarbamoyltransferase complex dimerization subunit type 1 TsaB [Oryzibacter oryziterrae]|uniref:tRNA (adenosine(37)-N6)-threonylcarbamoyltransferase complex dimerization subunit type 1 TsaB n=1 Tax=Oryzibacter oryziterrae TaxID=2766474 RepID=UPI001EFF8B59|nr:tRNA (adenosine(37)-N6)-threonylcarbamoyltransferase complex dimerization subunit type 1 TsaB [Oryzibacter oryziterrae]